MLEALGDAAKSLSHSSIEILHLSNLDISYGKGIDPRSEDLYNRTYSGIRSRERRHHVDLKVRLLAVARLVEEHSRIAQQILPVTTMIRIVAAEATLNTAELLGTVEELKSFHEHLDSKAEQIRWIHDVCTGFFQILHKGDG